MTDRQARRIAEQAAWEPERRHLYAPVGMSNSGKMVLVCCRCGSSPSDSECPMRWQPIPAELEVI